MRRNAGYLSCNAYSHYLARVRIDIDATQDDAAIASIREADP